MKYFGIWNKEANCWMKSAAGGILSSTCNAIMRAELAQFIDEQRAACSIREFECDPDINEGCKCHN